MHPLCGSKWKSRRSLKDQKSWRSTSRPSQTSRNQTSVSPSSSGLSKGICPLTKRRHAASHDELKRSSSSRTSSTNEVQQAYLCGVYILGDQGKELLREIHAGTCGHHAGTCGHHADPRTFVGKSFRRGFYWPTVVADSKDIVRRCKGCQFYA
jgi:hypothetical protein